MGWHRLLASSCFIALVLWILAALASDDEHILRSLKLKNASSLVLLWQPLPYGTTILPVASPVTIPITRPSLPSRIERAISADRRQKPARFFERLYSDGLLPLPKRAAERIDAPDRHVCAAALPVPALPADQDADLVRAGYGVDERPVEQQEAEQQSGPGSDPRPEQVPRLLPPVRVPKQEGADPEAPEPALVPRAPPPDQTERRQRGDRA